MPSREGIQCEDSHHGVHLTLDLGSLAGGSSRVEHNLRIATRHDDDTDDPVRVPQDRSAEEDRVERDGAPQVPTVLALASIVKDDGGVVGEHVDVGRLAVDGELGVGDEARGAEMGELGDGGAGLEVRLSIEVLRLDVADILLLGRGANDTI